MGLRLIFIGPPGSGKGTQSKLLKPLGFLHVSSGDMLRAEIATGSARGRAMAETVRSGGLVEDETLRAIMLDFLRAHAADSIVLDGYPRTPTQARQLAEMRIDAAVFFELDDAVLLRRLADRVLGPDGTIYDLQLHPPPPGVPVTRRADDDPAIHRRRLDVYRREEAELLAYYRKLGLSHEIAADRPMAEVHQAVVGLIARLRQPVAVG